MGSSNSSNRGALVLWGARSDIGIELAQRLCDGRPVVLAARGLHGLDEVKQALLSHGATTVHCMDFDATKVHDHPAYVAEALSKAGQCDVAIVAFGILGSQDTAEKDPAHAVEIANVDYVAQVSLLGHLANHMTKGHVVAFTSIAGWRARRANYVYGSTKAGLDAYCQGLADRLQGSSVGLITARPGFVIGKMSAGMKPAPLSVTPDIVAGYVEREVKLQWRTGRIRSCTLWIPRRLALLAAVMRVVPRSIWRHMPR